MTIHTPHQNTDQSPSGNVLTEGGQAANDGSDVQYIRSTDDVHAIVDSAIDGQTDRSARNKTLMIMIIALGGVFVDAYDFTSLSIGTVQLEREFNLSSTAVGLLSASMAISALFGALIGGYLADRLGRREMFILDLWIFVIAAIGCALAPNLTVLVIFRILMGLGVGIDFPVALSFVVEFCDRARRGLFVNSSYTNWYLAALVGFAASYLGFILGANESLWRISLGFGAVPALILIMLRRRYMEESPLWIAHQGDLRAAAQILRNTRNLNVQVHPDVADVPKDRSSRIMTVRATARTLFSKKYRSRSSLAAIIACLQSIEYYAVIFYLPVISQYIFGPGLMNAILGGVIFNAIGLLGAVFQAWVCDRTGLRPLALTGSVIAAISLVGVAFAHSIDQVALEAVMLGIFMLGHTVGPGPQGMAYAALSFPTRVRGAAIGWTQGMLRVGSICGFVFFPIVLSAFGFGATFTLLAVAPVIIAIALVVIRWEPIGKDIEAEGELS